MEAYRDTCDACVARKFADEVRSQTVAPKMVRKPVALRGPLLRSLTLVGILTGYSAGAVLAIVFPWFTLQLCFTWYVSIIVGTMACSIIKDIERSSWLASLTWPQLWCLTAWSPITLPPLFLAAASVPLVRLVSWIRTGE